MKILRNPFWFLVGLAVVALVLPAFAAGPEDFLGTWEGVYRDGWLDTTLIVEKVEDGKAATIYKRGTSRVWHIDRPLEVKVEGKFLSDGRLQLELPSRSGGIPTVTYTLNPDGTLTARFASSIGIFYAILSKKK